MKHSYRLLLLGILFLGLSQTPAQTDYFTAGESNTMLYDTLVMSWMQTYNSNHMASIDIITDITRDREGNIIVTGYSTAPGTSFDIVTIKYSRYGAQLWSNRYNGAVHLADYASKVKTDSNNNVYVLGYSVDHIGTQFCIIKYNSSGTQQWVISELYSSSEFPKVFTVTKAGDVYFSYQYQSSLRTVKYNKDGTLIKTMTYPYQNINIRPKAIKLDYQGNLYIAGTLMASNSRYNAFLLKYTSSDTLQWDVIYDNGELVDDSFLDIACDYLGGIYVTGQTASNTTGKDALTIKYNASGSPLWIAKYNSGSVNSDRGNAIAVDSLGQKIFITGYSVNGTDTNIVTVRYSVTGSQSWATFYTGTAGGTDIGKYIELTSSGEPVIAGYSYSTNQADYITIKYNLSGTEQWVSRYDGTGNGEDIINGMVIDAYGDIWVAGQSKGYNTNWDYAIVKYDAQGVDTWFDRYNGPGYNYDRLCDMIMDPSGNIVLCLESANNNNTLNNYSYVNSSNYNIVKYSPNGTKVWDYQLNNPNGGVNSPAGIAIDSAGSIYITGTGKGPSSRDIITAKVNSSGVLLWSSSFNGPANGWDSATAIKVTQDGYAHVTGAFTNSGTSTDILVLKYNPSGSKAWHNPINGTASPSNDAGKDILVDPQNQVWVTGYYQNTTTNYDIPVFKFSSAGAFNAGYQHSSNFNDAGYCLAYDTFGYIYMLGQTYNTSVNNLILMKIGLLGVSWKVYFDSSRTQHYGFTPRDLAIDRNNSIYVLAKLDSTNYTCLSLIKYNSQNGQRQWVKYYLPPYNHANDAITKAKMTLDTSGNIYISASVLKNSFEYIAVLMKYTPDGNLVWQRYFEYGTLSSIHSAHIAVSPSGDVYLAGYYGIPFLYFGSFLAKYEQITLSVPDQTSPLSEFDLYPNYPNPFNPTTTLRYHLKKPAKVSLKIYNTLGQEIRTLVNRNETPGMKSVNWDGKDNLGRSVASGVYIYRLEAGNHIKSRKMLLIR